MVETEGKRVTEKYFEEILSMSNLGIFHTFSVKQQMGLRVLMIEVQCVCLGHLGENAVKGTAVNALHDRFGSI